MNDALESQLKSIPLVKLNLSGRSHHSLRRAGLESVLDVCRVIDDNSILKINNIGVKSIEEIKNQTQQFLLAYGTSPAAVVQSAPVDLNPSVTVSISETQQLPDIKIFSDLPLEVLEDQLGSQLVENLASIGILNIGDINDLLKSYQSYLLPGSKLLSKTLDALVLIIRKKIDRGNLSPSCLVESTSLAELLEWKPVEDERIYYKFTLLKSILQEKSLTIDINRIFNNLTTRQAEIFLEYSFEDSTLDEIGTRLGVTRERIRQIKSAAEATLQQGLDKSLKVYISTAFEVAKELGMSLSKDTWKSELIKRKILTDSEQDYLSFNNFCALIKNKKTSLSIFGIPENVITILRNHQVLPIYVLNAIDKGIKSELREIKRIIKFTGGIAKAHAQQILGYNSEETTGILDAFGIRELIPGWFVNTGEVSLGKDTPLLRAGLIMMQVCGPLDFETFCDGVRRYISRLYDTIAPPEVLRYVLKGFGFNINENIVSYKGEESVKLGGSDQLLLDLVKEKGPVLSYVEIVEFYAGKGYSFATATARIMPKSPIIEKYEHGLYKLRGSKITWQDIESAKSRQEAFSRDAEVIYGLDGIIRYLINVGSVEIGGVLSISRSSQPIPDFPDGWPIYVDGVNLGLARRDESLIWGLSPAFNVLGVKLNDRIELAFNTWQQPRIDIRIVKEQYD